MRDRRHTASGPATPQLSAGTGNGRLSWTLLLAAALATLGVLRLVSDILTDIDPTLVSISEIRPCAFWLEGRTDRLWET